MIRLFTTTEFFSIFTALCLAAYVFLRRKRSSLPPGPPPLPILGNIFDMPTVSPWLTYREWSQQYKSDMIHVSILGSCMVIVNSLEVALDLLEKRGSIYSSRQRFPMVSELMNWGWNFAFQPYGDTWRDHRRLFNREFNLDASKRFYPQQIKATNIFLKNILQSPKDWDRHLRHELASVVMDIAYGIEVLEEGDPYVGVAGAAVAQLAEAAVPGKYLVDSLPILKYVPSWFPGAGFQNKAKECAKMSEDTRRLPWEAVKKSIAEGTAKPSFSTYCLAALDHAGDKERQEDIMMNTAGIIFSAGADTTLSALSTFILAMVLHPTVQARAQSELDAVLGKGTLPSFSHMNEDELPFLMAVVKESLRWHPVTPFGVPHQLIKDDVYKGYTLPKGTIIIPNTWAFLHDSEAYPDPLDFKPERFLTSEGKFNHAVRDPELAAFGYGRRICPGQHLARSSIWITAGCLLAMFNIQKPLDKDGKPVDPPGTYSHGFASYPDAFECRITPRSPEMVEIIQEL